MQLTMRQKLDCPHSNQDATCLRKIQVSTGKVHSLHIPVIKFAG